MAKKHRNRTHRSPHRPRTHRARGRAESAGPGASSAENAPLEPLRGALRAADPTAFWVTAAPIVTLVDEPGELADQLPDGVDLLQTFIDVNVAETTALLHMVAALSRDDLLRARCRRALRSRRQPIPPEITGLGQATVTGTRVFGDHAGDNHLVELTLPRGVRATVVIYVTRIPHLYLKDAFVVGEPLDEVQENFGRIMAADGFELAEILRTLDPAQSRAALEQAIKGIRPDIAKEPEEGDQWPMLRPLVEFVLSLLPEGGRGYDEQGFLLGPDQGSPLRAYPDIDIAWDEDDDVFLPDKDDAPPWIVDDDTDLVETFMSSPHAADLRPDPRTYTLAAYLLTFAAARGDDPLHWDPDVVRWVLQEVLPTDPLIPPDAVDDVPAVLPALVTWAHEMTEVDPDATEELQGEMALLLTELPDLRADPGTAVERLEALVDIALRSGDAHVIRRALLAQRVGGEDVLDQLDAKPLPVEPMDFGAVPVDVVERLREVDATLATGVDNVGDGMLELGERSLDEEFLTACRRFLVQAIAGDPNLLRRRASSRTTAAAVAWIVGRGNDLVGPSPAPVRTGDLMRAFEITNRPSSRAETLMSVALLPRAPDGVALGSPDLLVASARAAIIAQRDELLTDGSV